jgi:hypothetical protein
VEGTFNYQAQPSAELMEELTAMSSEQREFLRLQAKHDLYVLAKGILGYRDVNPQTHGAFCRFIQANEKRRRLGLMPRGHLKTTLGTIADSVRIPLLDVDETRILISGETATTAEKFLSEVKGHYEKNKILRFLFPELIPTRFAGPGVQWSSSMATLVRQSAYKEATWEAVGVGGAIVGGHFTRIKCDDLIGFEAMYSDAKMQQAMDWADNIEALLIDQHLDIIDFIGTRWRRNDLYAHIMKFYGARIAVFVREAIENGEVIFPAKHSLEVYETLQREKPLVWYSQYQNNPLASGQTDFPVGALQSFTFDLDGRVILRLPDGGYKIWRLEDLDRIVTADPNSGAVTAPDTAAVIASAISPDNEIIVLYAWSGRVSPAAFVDKIFEVWERWKPRVVGIEQAGQQTTRFYFDQLMEEKEIYIRVEPLKPKNRNKPDRIRAAMEPIIRSRRLYMLPTQTVLRKAVDEFPDTDPIDELDCLAYGTEEGMWRKPFRQKDVDEQQSALKLIINRRSSRTGY